VPAGATKRELWVGAEFVLCVCVCVCAVPRRVWWDRALVCGLQEERAAINMKRQAKRLPRVITPPEGPDGSKLAVAIRIKGEAAVPPKIKRILKSFRLNKMNHAVFVNLDAKVGPPPPPLSPPPPSSSSWPTPHTLLHTHL
jgi:ribosomal protein L30/L7E